MTTLYISHMDIRTDDLNRLVTTLTQEVMVKINANEENIFIGTLCELDGESDEEIITYHNETYTELDVFGEAVKKAIDAINSLTNHTLIAPVTEIHENELYRIEIDGM